MYKQINRDIERYAAAEYKRLNCSRWATQRLQAEYDRLTQNAPNEYAQALADKINAEIKWRSMFGNK